MYNGCNKMNNKQQQLNTLRSQIQKEKQGQLRYPGSKNIVFGEGNPNAQLLFIGEAPGRQEDEQGRPFVGRSGALLNKILETIGARREDVYITNIVKFRPPNNRKPTYAEMAHNKEAILEKQIEIIKPVVICTLGASALEGLLGHPFKITQSRGKTMRYQGMCVLPTYHPAYILRNPKELTTLVTDIKRANQIAQSTQQQGRGG